MSVETSYVQRRLGRVGAIMAVVLGCMAVVQPLLNGVREFGQADYWVGALSCFCWASLWLACKLIPMRARTLRIVEAVCIGGGAASDDIPKFSVRKAGSLSISAT